MADLEQKEIRIESKSLEKQIKETEKALTTIQLKAEEQAREHKAELKEQRNFIVFGLIVILIMVATMVIMVGYEIINSNRDRIDYDNLLINTQLNGTKRR